jgi:Ca2+-binding EF-hand superfamily protein
MERSGHLNNSTDADRAELIVETLFDGFDPTGSGFVDFAEITTGVSILCGGTSDDRTRAAFQLYDINGDGFITFPEFQNYLSAVFRIMYTLVPNTINEVGAPSDVLAATTARAAFEEFDINMDGRLSYDEFRSWYMASHAEEDGETEFEDHNDGIHVASHVNSLDDMKAYTGLGQISAHELFNAFEECTRGLDITVSVFREAFDRIVSVTGPPSQDSRLVASIADMLFNAFDTDHNGCVDAAELKSGLSILCGGGIDEKARKTFDLYDLNGDGYISRDEMTTYLTNVFRVMFQVDANTREQFKTTTPAKLAHDTTIDAFNTNDVNHDDLLSFEEFQAWYSASPAFDEDRDGIVSNDDDDSSLTIEEVRRLTCLDQCPIAEVFEVFAIPTDDDGLLSKSAFDNCFMQIITQNGGHASDDDHAKAMRIVDKLFDVFDEDGNGAVDFSELASGLSVLCGGSRDEKAEAAFALYDYNGDGFISLEEMTRYLTSVFKVMYETQPGTQERMGVSAEQLAGVTAEQAFVDADLNHDGRLSFEEFQSWYSSANESGDQTRESESASLDLSDESDDDSTEDEASSSVDSITLSEVRRVTCLPLLGVEEVFEQFAVAADEDGLLDEASFFNCFKQIKLQNGGIDEQDYGVLTQLCCVYSKFSTLMATMPLTLASLHQVYLSFVEVLAMKRQRLRLRCTTMTMMDLSLSRR